jgi:hypothetical protein
MEEPEQEEGFQDGVRMNDPQIVHVTDGHTNGYGIDKYRNQ